MGKHSSHSGARRWALALGTLVVVALVVALTVVIRARMAGDSDGDGVEVAGPVPTPAADCDQQLRVVTASSFAPVLTALAPDLARDDNCARLVVEVADGLAAVARLAKPGVDLWIPDDAAWAASARDLVAPESTAGSGTTVATSPIYMATDRATADRIAQAGGTWLALANLAAAGSGVRLAVRDPAGSGDGLVGAGAVAEAVWIARGMDASALALAYAKRVTRTVEGDGPALPARPGEVGLVPEYALLSSLAETGADLAVLAGRDHSPLLRYTWLPVAAAIGDPARANAMGRLLDTLTGPAGATAIADARLRKADASAPPPDRAGNLPPLAGDPLEVLGAHKVDHVFATWYAANRRTNLLIVVDISGSMRNPAPGTRTPLINLVRTGCQSVGDLLPDTARLGLWEFGTELDESRDHRVLLPPGALGAAHRQALARTVGSLAARRTGTGLYDTILAAYVAARDGYRAGMPNQVLVFTDGRNEDDAETITVAQLTAELSKARDPRRPVRLSVVTFGQRQEAKILEAALKPVDGYVASLGTAAEVSAVFIHLAAGGLHAD